jgi:hypothetical protein
MMKAEPLTQNGRLFVKDVTRKARDLIKLIEASPEGPYTALLAKFVEEVSAASIKLELNARNIGAPPGIYAK